MTDRFGEAASAARRTSVLATADMLGEDGPYQYEKEVERWMKLCRNERRLTEIVVGEAE
jgi:hypothetical protein